MLNVFAYIVLIVYGLGLWVWLMGLVHGRPSLGLEASDLRVWLAGGPGGSGSHDDTPFSLHKPNL